MLRILAMHRTSDQEEFMVVLRSTLARDRKQWIKFEKLFLEYWTNLDKAVDSKKKDVAENTLKKRPGAATFTSLKEWLYGNHKTGSESGDIARYSAFSNLSAKDFSMYSDEEMEDLKRVLTNLKRTFSRQKRRRFIRSTRNVRLDLRRTMRKNIRQGSEMINLQFRSRKKERVRLLIVTDVSKSMDLYSQFVVQFLYAFQQAFRSMETFIFSSTIRRITGLLKDYDFHESLKLLGDEATEWSGGTRIGASLDTLISNYRPLISANTHIIIMSDGWDDGDLDILASSMRWLSRKSGRVIWLNPLMANPHFVPETGGMKAALPYIDLLRPCHNLDSLRNLVTELY